MSDCLSEMDDAGLRKYAENSAPRLMAELCHLLDWDFVEGSEVESLKRQY
ncbi:MAG: hypothetical protein ACI81V_001129, partial [Lentimonas sp.]